jgi:hypothetical protein
VANPVTDPDILAKLEGKNAPKAAVTDPKLLEQLNATPGVAEDMAKAAVSGAGRGLVGIAGFPADMFELGSRGGAWINRKLGGTNVRQDQVPEYGSEALQKKVEGVTGEFYKPQTTAGKYAHTVGEFAPAVLAGPGGLARKAVTQVLLPGVASEAAGQATEGTKAEPYARVAAALGAGAAPGMLSRAVTPAPASPARQRLVDVLESEGVTSLTAGQRTGNEMLRYAESALGNAPFTGQAANRITRQGQEQFTDAVLRRAGTAGEATPETLRVNSDRLGQNFRDLSARNTLQLDPQFAGDVQGVIREYGRVLPTEQRQILYNILTDIGQLGNAIPGQVYQTTRSRLSRMATGTNDVEFGRAIRGVRDALDNAMDRSISPGDRDLWRQTRREYGAQKVIEKAASRAGEATAEGQIVPANLRNTVAAENRGAYARGQGDFSELARAGAGIMAPMPQSGTAPRSMLYNISNMLSGGAVPALAGRALMSGPVQRYAGNQVVPQALQNLDPRRTAVINALMAAEQQRLLAPSAPVNGLPQ